MNPKAPAFQFYPKDILSDFNVMAMTLEEFGAYVKLLAVCWQEQGIPNEPDRIAHALAIPREHFDRLWPAIAPCFFLDGNLWQQKRLNAERDKQRKFSRSRQLNGLKGGRPAKTTSFPVGSAIESQSKAKKSSASAFASASADVPKRWQWSSLTVTDKMHAIVAGSIGPSATRLEWDEIYLTAAEHYRAHGEPADRLDDLKKRARQAAQAQRDRASGPPDAAATLANLNRVPVMSPEERVKAQASLRRVLAG